MNKTPPLGKNRSEQHRAQARSGLRVPLPVALVGLGVMAAVAPTQAWAYRVAGTDDSYTMQSGTTLNVDVVKNDVAVDDSGGPNTGLPANPPLPHDCFFTYLHPTDWSDPPQSALPQHGTATITEHGGLTYTPNPGFVGVDTFKYFAKLDDSYPEYSGGPGSQVCQGPGCTFIQVTVTVTKPAPASAVVTAVPTLAPVALGGLGALLGVLGMRRRRRD